MGESVKWILFALAILIIIFSFRGVYDALLIKPVEEVNCAANVAAHSRAIAMSGGEVTPEFVCPSREVDLRGAEDPAALVAEEMRWCWQSWGRGEYELFSRGEDRTYCHVCSMIRSNQEFTGLAEYMDSNEVSPGVTYREFFAPNAQGGRFTEGEVPYSDVVVRGDQAIIFFHVKGAEQINTFFGSFGADTVQEAGAAVTAAGAGGAVAIGVCIVSLGCGVAMGTVAVLSGLMTAIPTYIAGTFGVLPKDASLSAVVLSEVNPEDIEDLGCGYAPARRNP